jgi:hypothetical protein
MADAARHLAYHEFGIGAIVVGLTCLAAAIWLRRVRRFVPPPSFRTAWALVVLFALVHAAIRPLVDPAKDMAEGAAEAASLVPADEPLLVFSGDETTLAVVPFFSGRLVANAEKPADAIRALDAGPSKHLLVMDKDVKRMGTALESRVTLVRTVRFAATRDVNVYALKP